jgi:hypothetical protein
MSSGVRRLFRDSAIKGHRLAIAGVALVSIGLSALALFLSVDMDDCTLRHVLTMVGVIAGMLALASFAVIVRGDCLH